MNRIRSTMMVLAAGWLCAGMATAQTAANLTIVSGDGQIVCPFCFITSTAYAPLVVMATDVNGNPVPGVQVNWNITAPNIPGAVFLQSDSTSTTSTTNSSGQASVTFYLTPSETGGSQTLSVLQDSITASTGNNVSATFYESEALQDLLNTGFPPVTANFQNNSYSVLQAGLSGQVGATGQTPIQIYVANEGQQPVPNVAVFLVTAQINSGSPTIACAPTAGSPTAGAGVVLTNSNGIATCYPTYGGSPGSGLFWMDVGGSSASVPVGTLPPYYFLYPANAYNAQTGAISGFTYSVSPGTPGSTSVVSGSGQSANPGQTLTQPLVAQVVNAGGQPLAGVTVTWTVSPANAATLASTTTTGSNGQTSNTVTLSSSASGAITVTASASGTTSSATFTITAIPAVTITGFSIVSGNNQSAVEGTGFAEPLVVQVSTSNGVASGVTVQFQVQGGSVPVTLSSNSAVTGASGQAQITVQAGSVAGSATVVASVSSSGGGSSQTFNLTVVPVPQVPVITAANFVNGADEQPNSLSPCSLGLLLASSLGVANVSPLYPGLPAPQTSVAITFNSISAPILNIGTNALGQQFALFQVPCTVSAGASIPVTVTIAGSATSLTLNVLPASPGVFHTVMSDGVARAVVVRPDGSFVSLTNPARRGETEVTYVTGLGPTSPAVGTTALPVPGQMLVPSAVLGTVIPGMSGAGLPLVYAQLSEDLPGVYVVAFQIPATETQGNNISFSIGILPAGSTTGYYSAPTTIPVQ